jgi:thioredoxin reductase (NADPH)
LKLDLKTSGRQWSERGEFVVKDLVIAGAGVAGLAAGIAARRQGLTTTLFDPMGPGGALMNAGTLDFLPGYGADLRGSDLIGRLTDEVLGDEVQIEFGTVESIEKAPDGFVLTVDGATVEARRVILAMGATHRQLGVSGEDEFEGRGVSHCAICDGGMFAGKDVVVVGGGDSACESAAYLSTLCNLVTVVHRGDRFDAVDALRRQVEALENVSVRLCSEIIALEGDKVLKTVTLRAVGSDGVIEVLAADGLFLAVGFVPSSDPLASFVKLSDDGTVQVDERLETSVPGVFAIGAIRTGHSGQLASAIGEGAAAGLAAGRSLRDEA